MNKFILLFSLCIFSSASWSNCVGDCVNGYGTYTNTNGDKYVGQGRQGLQSGQGTFTWPDGRKYVGQFKAGLFSGHGTFTFSGKDKSFFGIGAELELASNRYFRVARIVPGGAADLHGVLKTSDMIIGVGGSGDDIIDIFGWKLKDVIDLIRGDAGSTVKLKTRTKMFSGPESILLIVRDKVPLRYRLDYVGQFKDGALAGEGTLTYLDGSSFVGEFKNDEPERGTEFLADKRQLIFNSGGTELRLANGQLLRADILDSELDRIREKSLENSRLIKEQLLKEQRQNQTIIAGIQRQLIEYQYLGGVADSVAGRNTSKAIEKFYRDIEVALPARDDYTTINEDLDLNLMNADGVCSEQPANQSKYTVCFNTQTKE